VQQVSWSDVADRLASAHIYWLHTTRRSGEPHAAPVWGAVVDGKLHLYSQRSTVKASNIEHDPRAVIHLESGADVLILHGVLSDLGRPQELPSVVDALSEKYDQPEEQPFLPSTNLDFDVMYVFTAERALLWTLPDSEASTRRWLRAGGS
jgi:Pyridoxamine 5'-phosphate oxidase